MEATKQAMTLSYQQSTAALEAQVSARVAAEDTKVLIDLLERGTPEYTASHQAIVMLEGAAAMLRGVENTIVATRQQALRDELARRKAARGETL